MLLSLTLAAAVVAGPVTYQHCVKMTDTSKVCFLERATGKYTTIAVAESQLDELLEIPWAGGLEGQIEVLDELTYEDLAEETYSGYEYDFAQLPDGNFSVGGWGEDVNLDSLDGEIDQWVDEFADGAPEYDADAEGPALTDSELAHKDAASLYGHSPDESKCHRAILGGAVRWAASGGSGGAKLGAFLGGFPGAVAGGAAGGSIGFVAGALWNGFTSPYCEHDDHEHAEDKDGSSSDEKKDEDKKDENKKEGDSKDGKGTTVDPELSHGGAKPLPENWEPPEGEHGDPDAEEGEGGVEHGEIMPGGGVVDADEQPRIGVFRLTKLQLLLDPTVPESVTTIRLEVQVR